jgi:hypothetical protein
MIIKNINPAQSGHSELALINLGTKQVRLAYNETAIFPDDDSKVYRDARNLESQGLIEIVEGPAQTTHLSPKTLPAWSMVTVSDTGTDEDTLTIGDVVFELDDDASVTAGNVSVTIGDDAEATADALATAINASTDVLVKATRGAEGSAEVIYLHHKTNAVTGSSVALAESSTALTIIGGGTELEDGTYGANMSAVVATLTATATTDRIVTGLTAIDHFIVQVRTAAGAIKAYDGAITTSGGVIYLDAAGSTDIAATDTITVIAFG